MGKTMKDFHFRDRIPVPRPGRPMPTEKDYNRKRDKRVLIPEDEEDSDD